MHLMFHSFYCVKLYSVVPCSLKKEVVYKFLCMTYKSLGMDRKTGGTDYDSAILV